jgi:hypothetical protein
LFVRFSSDGLSSFAQAAALSCAALAIAPKLLQSVHNPVLAGMAGALLSPCSSADALLAAMFFRTRAQQLVFIVAAQCLDTRQLSLLAQTFGPAHTIRAAIAALAGCTIGYILAQR